MSVAPSSASSPTSPVFASPSRLPALRALDRPSATTACLAIAGLQPPGMDMIFIRPQGTTASPLEDARYQRKPPEGKAPTARTYSGPTALGVPEGTTVKATSDHRRRRNRPGQRQVPQASQAEPNTISRATARSAVVTIQPFLRPSQDANGASGAWAAHLRPPSGDWATGGPRWRPHGLVDTITRHLPGAGRSRMGEGLGTTVTLDAISTSVAKGVSAPATPRPRGGARGTHSNLADCGAGPARRQDLTVVLRRRSSGTSNPADARILSI